MKSMKLVALLATFVLVMAACSSDDGGSDTTAAPTTTAIQPGDYVNLVGGGQIDLNSIEGQDTVLWFWAPW